MRALTIDNGALEVRERPTPTPQASDVLVEVHAAGVNAADLLQRRGLYPAPEGWPSDVPGLELAGVVCALGPGASPDLLGRRVCAVVGGGAQATHCLVPSEHLLFVPDGVSWDAAGAFPEAFTTAYDALVSQGHVAPGERVLISGAAGGVGVASVQIARAYGARVIAVTRTSEHHATLRALGAHETLTFDGVGGLSGIDLLVELVGAAHLDLAQRTMAPAGRIVVIGVGSGARVELDLLRVMTHRLHLTGSTLRARSRDEKSRVAVDVNRDVVARWATGELTVPLARVVDLTDATSAYEFFAQPGKFGKVVLRVSDESPLS